MTNIDTNIVDKYKDVIFREMFEKNDYESLFYLVKNFDINVNYYYINKLLILDRLDIVKTIFDKTKYSRKELKNILLISCRNQIYLSYFVDDCDILPTIGCIKRSYIQNYDQSFNFLLNHKTFIEIYNKFVQNIDYDNEDRVIQIMKNKIRELKLKRIING